LFRWDAPLFFANAELFPECLLDAVAALREDAWERAVDAVPEVVDDRDVERWLDEYEAIYAALRGVRSPG